MKIKNLIGDLSYEEIKKRKWKRVIYQTKKGKNIYYYDYIISEDGLVMRITKHPTGGTTYPGRLVKIKKPFNFYSSVRLSLKNNGSYPLLMHRLMWRVWRGKIPIGHEVNHKDGDKTNYTNFVEMECITAKENMIHALETGLNSNKGENHYRAKLTKKKAREICYLYAKGGWTQKRLGEKFGVVQSSIGAIIQGRRWN